MQVVSVNVGQVQSYPWRGGTRSGIHKTPLDTAVLVTEKGLEGDHQADLKNHGGEDKAVLIIPTANYVLHGVSQHAFGFLGENISLSEVDESQVKVGDRFQIDDVILEVTQPRSPCWKLGEMNGSQLFVKNYSFSGRVGFCCRVLAAGEIQASMPVKHLKTGQGENIQTLFLAKFNASSMDDYAVLQEALENPALSDSWSQSIRQTLTRRFKDD
ncbi:MOSC domain-containing protein [Hydrogenovibrio sp. 3SP14C1]|uniref:MOSC domain-containing protein n=1 Tax=Hydrogenovibrio sp. 3SP14C1 TaxID=3038774 RepID=UPI002417BB4A|nr:MOSC domain-containing protein [Hydrogenovibrio sp. 3SP14C1]MDG4813246.1 MOSC domain-containing protein [Hydrogenovibrio sp. 3SP14C1]